MINFVTDVCEINAFSIVTLKSSIYAFMAITIYLPWPAFLSRPLAQIYSFVGTISASVNSIAYVRSFDAVSIGAVKMIRFT